LQPLASGERPIIPDGKAERAISAALRYPIVPKRDRWLSDFHRATEGIEVGRSAAEKALDSITEMIAALR